MADSNSDKQSIDISQEIKNIILSLSENDYAEEEAPAVHNYKNSIKSRENSLRNFEILKSNNSDFYDIQKEFNKACIYSSSVRYYEKNEHIKAIVKREKEKPDYLYNFKESASVSYSIPKAETISDFEDQIIKPSVIKSVFLAILLLIIFAIVFFISIVLVTLILNLLLELPLISFFLSWTFDLVNGSPVEFANIVSILISYGIIALCASNLCKNKATAKLSIKISGITIIVLHTLFLVLNIIYKENFFINILTILYSLAFLHTYEDSLN